MTFKTWNSVKQVFIFHLILVGIPPSLIFSVKARAAGEAIFTLPTKYVKNDNSYLSTMP